MKTNIKSKTLVLALIAAVAMGGCTTMGPDGKPQTSAGNTAGAGAAAGAAIGYLLGGNGQSMLIGAALGGGAGYLVALDMQKKELEAAKVAAAEITRSSEFLKPVVYTQGYQDTASGTKAEGLKSIDMELPIGEMTNKKGALNEKGEVAMLKLQSVTDRIGGTMDIVVPRNLKPATYKALVQAAPKAKIIVADGNTSIVKARIHGKPLDNNSGVRMVNA